MQVGHRGGRRAALIVVLSALAALEATAAGWMDDFNDGSITDNNPVTWITDLGGSGLFPGDYDASSGDLRMDPAVGSPTSQMSALVPVVLGNTYIRTQGKVLPDPSNPSNVGGNLVVTARVDPEVLGGYLLYFDVSGNLNLQVLLGGGSLDLTEGYSAPFNAGSEVVIQLDIIGNQLNGYAWEASDPNGKPATPQVSATDTLYAAGLAGLGYAEDDDGTFAIYRYVAAQDTPFVDLNPSNGDFDGNGTVDGADFLIWQRGYGLTNQSDATTGDADDDGDVDDADLVLWRSHFGGPPAAIVAAAVPEPATLWLAAFGATVGAGLRRRERVAA
jgi:hypothetical protein